MEYSKRFHRQWQKLIDDFSGYTASSVNYGFDLQRLNLWYKDNTFRWRSIASAEGELLNSQDESLKKHLLSEIDKFSFSRVEKLKKPSFIFCFIPMLILGIAAGVLLNFKLNLQLIVSIVVGLVFALAGVIIYAKLLGAYEKKEKKRLCEEYSIQLKNHGETLCNICKEYEKQM